MGWSRQQRISQYKVYRKYYANQSPSFTEELAATKNDSNRRYLDFHSQPERLQYHHQQPLSLFSFSGSRSRKER